MDTTTGATSIRMRSIPNVDDDRLMRRLAHLLDALAKDQMPSLDLTKAELSHRARERAHIVRELVRRGVLAGDPNPTQAVRLTPDRP